MNDQIAISRLKQGDATGLETLVNHYQVRAVYTAYLIVYNRSLAEEIAQTAFVHVAEKIHQFDETRPFAPWFFRIVINEAIQVAKEQKQNVSLDNDPDNQVQAVARWLVDPQPQPEKFVEIKEARQLILAALQRLSPEQRAVMVMRYFLEMSEMDMSVRMKRPVSTIKWWLRAARERMRHLLSSSHLFEDQK